ncbi:MAG: hypothetical protein M3361_09935 [Candidatus Tectomicrobia bacterium]|nr:hypothetical protein [Candidatus Tectomicrobia bacterium]
MVNSSMESLGEHYMERTTAWLGAFCCLVGRYEQLSTTYAGFFHLACALLTLRRVLK